MKRILIDISNVVPGKGGAGGGVWVYAMNLLHQLDQMPIATDLEFICLKNKHNTHLTLANIKVYVNPFQQNSVVGRMLSVHLFLPLFCLRRRVSLLHKVTPELPIWLPVKRIITLHDFIFQYYLSRPALHRYLSRSTQWTYRLIGAAAHHAIRYADAVVVPTQAVQQEMGRFLPSYTKAVYVTHEAAFYEGVPASKTKSRPGILRILVVAGFFPHKGYHAVIALARYMIDQGFTHFHITFRGSNPGSDYAREVKERIHAEGLSGFIKLATFVQQHDLSAIYGEQDCFLLLSECEGFGLPVIEAQLFGLPVICSDIPVFRELLGDSAIYVDPNNLSSAFNEVKQLLHQQGVYQSYVAKGHQNAKRFSWKQMADTTFSVYSHVLGMPN